MARSGRSQNLRFGMKAGLLSLSRGCPFSGKIGRHLLILSFSQFDPTRKSHAWCARLDPAQEKRLQFAFALHVNASTWLQREGTDELAGGILRHMDSIGQRIGLEPTSDIYSIAPYIVDEAVCADDAGNHGTGVYADPDLQRPAEMAVDPA